MLLSKMRTGIFSYLFLGFLVLGGAGLVMMDWTGSYSRGGGSTDVAVVGGEPIRAAEFDRAARRIIRAQKMDPQLAYHTGMIDQILQLQVMDLLLQKAAREYGVAVEDKLIARQINTLIEPMMAKAGGASKKEILARILQSQNMSEAELVDNLRSDMARNLLRNAITQNYYVPAALATDLYAYRHETRTADTVMISFDKMKVDEPDDVDLGQYFDAVKGQYTEPESRSFTMGIIDPDTFGKKVTVSDEEVTAYYKANEDAFRAEERRLLQQAVVDTEDKAKAILKDVQKGKKSLKDAVKAATGSTSAFTDDNGFEKAGLPVQLAEPVFAAAEGSYVGPLKSPLGYHIIFVKKNQPAQLQPLETAKENIRKELLHDKKADEIFEATTVIEDRVAAGEKLEDLAKDMGMTLVPVKDVRMSMSDVPALKPYAADQENILQAAFKLQDGESSPLADMTGGKMFTIRADKITAKRQKELKEVKADVITRWKGEQRKKAAGEIAAKALKELDAKKTTLADVAKAQGSKIVTFSNLSRDQEPQTGLTAGNMQQLMGASRDMNIIMPSDKGIMLGKITSIKQNAKTPTPKDIAETKEQLGRDASQENLLSFVDAMQAKYKTVTNKKLLEQMYAANPEEGQQP